MCKIKVVDSIMGSGKTGSMINYINNNPDENFIFITPYLNEIKRVKNATKEKNKMYEPNFFNKTSKKDDFHKLLSEGKSVCSTHALFRKADDVTRLSLKANDYILILDEVMNIVEEISFSEKDMEILFSNNFVYVEDDFLKWNKEKIDYNGKFNEIKNMALNNNLIYVANKLIFWNFPVDIFKYFKEVYILTYMFDCQIQRYYYDFHNIEYNKFQIDDNHKMVEYNNKLYSKRRNELKSLISIYEGKYNLIGDEKFALSKSWFEKYKDDLVPILKKNLYNYFNNKGIKSKFKLWTTFKKYRSLLSSKGYTKSFIPLNTRATNLYQDSYQIAYCCNKYVRPTIKTFFSKRQISINEDDYALSEMLQWIWRSRVRQNQKINIYIPSKRMRNLLIKWLHDESK